MVMLLELVIVSVSSVLFSLLNLSLPQCLRPSVPLAGFAEWKWRNIVVSLIHSIFSGLCAFYLTSDYIFATPDVTIQALQHELHGRLLLCVSIGYFVYDSVLSILQLGKYPGRMEIIVHHAITMVTLGSALLDSVPFRQLLPFCVFGLVIEINNIFIHIRSLMEISRYVNSRKSLFLYNMNSVCALFSVFTFRFVPLYWITKEIAFQSKFWSPLEIALFNCPIVAILLISGVIFWRIVREDFYDKRPLHCRVD